MIDKRIIPIEFTKELLEAYKVYSVSVSTNRAIADARDGCKPVMRRILWGLSQLQCNANSNHKKSARVIGDVMGKYHPHGTSSIYETMIRMSQDFSMYVSLVDCHGNNGSIDGDKPAADRYTEVRLTHAGELLLKNINENTVKFIPNYDNTDTEPTVLPATYPALLINGVNGIAVGISTNIPPHNPREILNACIALLHNPKLSIAELCKYIPGPDFPTGGQIYASEKLMAAYTKGRGSVILEGIAKIENNKIIITEIPYQVRKSTLVEAIAELVNNETITGISDIIDESNRHGIKIVISLKKYANSDIILDKIYQNTQLRISIPIQITAIHDEIPKQLNLLQLLQIFISFREEIILNRTKFRIERTTKKAVNLVALLMALDNLDLIISTIRKSETTEIARKSLMALYWTDDQLKYIKCLVPNIVNTLTEEQAQHILELKLQRITKLERTQLQKDLEILSQELHELNNILYNREYRKQVLQHELEDIQKLIGIERKTRIINQEKPLKVEGEVEANVIIITADANIKRTDLSEYHAQKRGGKGKSCSSSNILSVITALSNERILFFSKLTGKVYVKNIIEIPKASLNTKGKNLLTLLPEKNFSAILGIGKNKDDFIFVTSSGYVRRNDFESFASIRAGGKNAIKLSKNEALVTVFQAAENQNLILFTRYGKAIHFSINEIKKTGGRESKGVKGIELDTGDTVIAAHATNPNTMLLTLSAHGYGKQTAAHMFRISHRGGKGVYAMKKNQVTGDLIDALPITAHCDVIIISKNGQVIRIHSEQIREASRNTKGVKLFNTNSEILTAATTANL